MSNAGLERGRRAPPKPGTEVRSHCPAARGRSRQGAPPDFRSRQSARRPAQGRGTKIRHIPVRSLADANLARAPFTRQLGRTWE